uniref:Uncharacterized protein n=1 Tax=Bos taurus TaxID=9913 RepID=A0AAA9TL35_BOVIN
MLNLHQIQKFWTKDWLNSLMKFYCKCFPKFHKKQEEQQTDQLQRETCKKASYPSQKSSRETDFALSSNKRDEHLAKLFGATVDGNSHEPEFFFDSTGRMSNNDHIAEEQRDQESSLFNRDVSDTQSTTINKGTLQEAVSPDVLRQTSHTIFL